MDEIPSVAELVRDPDRAREAEASLARLGSHGRCKTSRKYLYEARDAAAIVNSDEPGRSTGTAQEREDDAYAIDEASSPAPSATTP